jgi:hypothetical protein
MVRNLYLIADRWTPGSYNILKLALKAVLFLENLSGFFDTFLYSNTLVRGIRENFGANSLSLGCNNADVSERAWAWILVGWEVDGPIMRKPTPDINTQAITRCHRISNSGLESVVMAKSRIRSHGYCYNHELTSKNLVFDRISLLHTRMFGTGHSPEIADMHDDRILVPSLEIVHASRLPTVSRRRSIGCCCGCLIRSPVRGRVLAKRCHVQAPEGRASIRRKSKNIYCA